MLMRQRTGGWLRYVALASVSLLLGFLLVTQIRTLSPSYEERFNKETDSDRAAYLSQVYVSVNALRQELETLRRGLATSQQNDTSALVAKEVEETDRLRAFSGAYALTGPGVSVQIRGDVSTFDLQDLINELRNAGAEGISLNGSRVVARTVVANLGGQVITVDSKPIRSPFILRAVGSAADLRTALERRGGLLAILQAKEIEIQVTEDDSIIVPKLINAYETKYAQPAPTAAAAQ